MLTLLVLALSFVAAVPGASAGPGNGNSANAKTCQKGGWEQLAPAVDPGTPFASQDECVGYGANGGVLTAYVPPPPTINVEIVPSSFENECVAQVHGEGFPVSTTLRGFQFFTIGGDGNSFPVSVDTTPDGTFSFTSPSDFSNPNLRYLVRVGGILANEVPFTC
jgi:hypothetical protein